MLPPAPPTSIPAESIQSGPATTDSPHVWTEQGPWEEFSGDVSSFQPLGEPFETHFEEDTSDLVYSTNDLYRRGFWYSQQDLVVLLRTETKDIIIGADVAASDPRVDSVFSKATIITSKTTDPTFEPGTRLTLGRFLGQDIANRDHAFEFTFFGLFDYTESGSLASSVPGSLRTPLGPGLVYFTNGVGGSVYGPSSEAIQGFDFASQYDTLYASDLNSFELNWRMMGRPTRDRLALQPNGNWIRHGTSSRLQSILIGMRAISINELFRLNASFTDPTTLGTHQVQTNNDMYGFQLGFDSVESYTNWSWGARFKAGGLYNFAERRSKIDQLLEGTRNLRTQDINKENLAVMLEGGLTATYQLRRNLTAHVASDAMYVTGFATAPENLGITPAFVPFEVTGDAIFLGMSVGLEMLW